MKKQQDFQEIRRQVGMYFDQALTKDDEQNFLQKIRTNPNFNQEFERERTIREHLRKCVKRPNVSANLIQSIKDKIRIV
jgi:ABC-type phosphate transport system ATPase subunit